MSKHYYNEIDPHAAQWLQNLIDAGLIAAGDIDQRSITDVKAPDLKGYTQCHFFAGIGGWPLALQIAGWSDDRPVWTGSCPCQPFSSAGKQKIFKDERHLWPVWFKLIGKCRPPVIFGEQVASAIGHGWLDLVFTDLERQSYACGAAVLPACSVGAPHIRQRCWFVADADGGNQQAQQQGQISSPDEWATSGREESRFGGYGGTGVMADAPINRRLKGLAQSRGVTERIGAQGQLGRITKHSVTGELDDAASGRDIGSDIATGVFQQPVGRSPWSGADWLPCTDGKARPVEPGTFPLVDGLSFKLGSGGALEGKSRAGMLRAYGNAVVPQVAAAFVMAFLAR